MYDLASPLIWLLNGVLGSWYARRLFGKKYPALPVCLLWAAGFGLLSVVYASPLWRTAGILAVFWGLSTFFFRGEQTVRAFAALTFTAGSELVRFISSALYAALYQLWLPVLTRLVEGGDIQTPRQAALWTDLPGGILLTVCILVQFGLLWGYLSLLARQVPAAGQGLRTHEALLFLLPGVTGLCVAVTLRYLVISVEEGMTVIVYQTVPATLFWVPLICLLMLGMIAASAVLFQKLLAFHRERQQRLLLEARVDEVQDIYGEIRTLGHDLRGHLANLAALALRKEDGELSAYMGAMEESLSRLEVPLETGHPVTDVILRRQVQEGARKGIRLEGDFHHPQDIDAYDMGVILDNALTNALEACQEAGGDWTALRSYRRGSLFFLEVENPWTGELAWDPETGLPVSGKGQGRGLGLSSIRRQAEKYRGGLDIQVMETQKEKVFRLTVMLCGKSFTP